MPVGDLYRATVNWAMPRANAANVFHFLQQDPDGAEDPAAQLAAGLGEQLDSGLMPLLSDQIAGTTIAIKRLLPTATQTRIFPWTTSGVLAEEILPPQTNLTVGLYTDVFSKRGRGRMRIPGLSVNSIEGSNFLSSVISSVVAWAVSFASAWSAAGSAINWVYQIYSIVDGASRAVQKVTARPQAKKIRSRRT